MASVFERFLRFVHFGENPFRPVADDTPSQPTCLCLSRLKSLPQERVTVHSSLDSNDQHVEIFGIPPQVPNTSSPHKCEWPAHLLLSRPCRAQSGYKLGPDWRQQLKPQYGISAEYTYIPLSSDPIDEAEHCLRMRRCGAHLVRRERYSLTRYDQELLNPEVCEQLFGWPSSGGVWVLKIREDMMWTHSPEDEIDPTRETIVFGTTFRPDMDLRKHVDMDGYYSALKKWGAVYYDDITTCPEVVRFELCKP